jgi:predicted AlkP superfamily phosphohydrolase/phosphomutase
VPISSPRSFAGDLARRLGPMKTQGWPEDTFARNDGVTDDVQMYEEIRDTYRAHERLCLDRLDRSGAALLSIVFTATDRMQHMFFRYRDRGHPAHDPEEIAEFKARTGVADPILESYRWMDDTVAAVLERLDDDDILILVSDHGFHSFRQGVNLNTWLLEEGYLVLKDPEALRTERNLDQLFRGRVETSEIDWTKTRAYALGLGQIFVNLAGRESSGIVPPVRREALLDEISAKLTELRSAKDEKVFDRIYRGEEIWTGERMEDAPDLQCGFADRFRVSWQTALLGVPNEIFEVNRYAWSGDHCSNDPANTAGFFMSNRRLGPDADPGLEDIARTVCALFDAPPPSKAEGKILPLLPR